MIVFKELRWSNVFSYGPDNALRFDDALLTQLVGKNGYGKSSIGLIIEEVLFNTNSKKIKKSDIINRYVKDKHYAIELDFEKDGTPYTVSTRRTSSTGSVTLVSGGVDISSHTATATYKQIEGILGYDHKTFCQIVYQSSVSSLEFLTATDTSRKAFLIELLNLSKYTSANDVFKKLASDAEKRVNTIEAKLSVINSWFAKMAKEDLTLHDLVLVPEQPSGTRSDIARVEESIKNIDSTNKKIQTNNTYRKVLASIELNPWVGDVPNSDLLIQIQVDIRSKESEMDRLKKLTNTGKSRVLKCPTCSQDIDNSTAFEKAMHVAAELDVLAEEVRLLKAQHLAHDKLCKLYSANKAKTSEWEKYSALVDKTLTTILEDENELQARLKALNVELKERLKAIEIADNWNTQAQSKNARAMVITEQFAEMRNDQSIQVAALAEISKEAANLQILAKAFSNTGLVAYKLECLVKDLESLTNEYLAELADGRFQLSFKITSSDKLNVVITDNGRDIEITALSSGERARVNVAALLAIRKLMQTTSNSRTNLLILDETVENLDAEGKEKLIGVLLEEADLNTFLISHGFSHPLLEKINVVKHNNISRIE